MRIAILNRDRCQPDTCSRECIKYCPRVRTGDETIVIAEGKKPVISEELCIGCGICVNKCPFEAIHIISLPESLTEPTHRYGENGFVLFGLPLPQHGKTVGILGPNGIGKTTAVQILSGNLKPNLDADADWEDIFKYYAGSAMQDYLRKISKNEIRLSQKPQYVDRLPEVFSGKVSELLEKVDERGELENLIAELEIGHILNRNLGDLSGGELQRVAIAACAARDADFYFFDEISPYLDIYQRIHAAILIRKLASESAVLVVEHDLAILDLLADVAHIGYGEPGGFGVITHVKGVRQAINQYLRGFLPEENVRTRPDSIDFEVHAPRSLKDIPVLFEFPEFTKTYDGGFSLSVAAGELRAGEVVGAVGPNGIGKSTFAKLLAGVEEPTTGKISTDIRISYKPQYIKPDSFVRVHDFLRSITRYVDTSYYETSITNPLQLKYLMEREISDLSGGELQRVAIAACLSRDADLYVLDEPSAHLDVEQRVSACSAIRRFAENKHATAIVIDHDIYMVDLLSDRLLVFEGEPAVHGEVFGPFGLREGMNRFLKNLDITFRRDEETKRPRINKPGSRLDREQKANGEYYYAAVE
ncbi:MAG: ribosome biogenesis/translation initiation ATPase RLI [ANME-2 cluster archaeon]|nr:MAG: ribosome biogenesis/translation initiation ATPase RLI [ANME-2 cluster archaeon]